MSRGTATIAVVDSGYGNLRSVERALCHVGGHPVVTADPDVVRKADKVVVPGQGAFRDCMAGLSKRGLGQAVREKIASGAPYLGICLGLQVLFDESEEQGPCQGMGLIRGRVIRFLPEDRTLKVPHMGWNHVRFASGVEGDPLFRGISDGSLLYFVHSYFVVPEDPTVIALRADYGGAFCAAVRQGNVFACQFHPEKSQKVGLRLLANFAGAP
ncbi:MAG: imidazole glycerol phosphate synthase subunit HisH [Deltaproteobacteria bacterium]|nr:imidazole glycerol phosphate synthase subunit HisH [Deltaproteobacteria bacterium]